MIIGVQTLVAALIIALFVGKHSNTPKPLPPVVNPVKWIKYPKKQNYKNSSNETADLKAIAVEPWGQDFTAKYLLQK